MDKKAQNAGVLRNTALVILGWSSLIGSFFVESTIAVILLNMIARVLP